MIRTINKSKGRSTRLSLASLAYQGLSRALVMLLPFIPSQKRYNISISHHRKFLWFRVAKVGTRTIFDGFDSANVILDSDHAMECHYRPESYSDYFRFAFVRNPWDRLVSCWHDKVVDRNYFEFKDERWNELKQFDRFVQYVEDLDIRSCDHHLRAQSCLVDLNNIDFLGRFENFESDLCYVMEKLNLETSTIPRVNATNRTDYHEYYSQELAQRVGRIYALDISMFNYAY